MLFCDRVALMFALMVKLAIGSNSSWAHLCHLRHSFPLPAIFTQCLLHPQCLSNKTRCLRINLCTNPKLWSARHDVSLMPTHPRACLERVYQIFMSYKCLYRRMLLLLRRPAFLIHLWKSRTSLHVLDQFLSQKYVFTLYPIVRAKHWFVVSQ